MEPKLQAEAENFGAPVYSFSETVSGACKIVVDPKGAAQGIEKAESARKKIIMHEAQKDPLFAMALVQKLAQDGDVQAQKIMRIYQAWCKFLENSGKDELKKCCEQILAHSTRDQIENELARYVDAIIRGLPLDPSLEEAKLFLNTLIPGIERALRATIPEKLYDIQEVVIAEEKGQYKAFPDIIKYDGHYLVCFREANSHVGYKDFGSIRVIKGDFNNKTVRWEWKNAALLSLDGYDLRDPHFFITAKNELKMVMGASIINELGDTIKMVPHVASLNNNQWDLAEASLPASSNGPKGAWLWRVTQNRVDSMGYGLSYGKGSSLGLMETPDGLNFKKITDISCEPLTDLSEGTLRFGRDGTVYALIRTKRNGIIGKATPQDNYTKWSFNSIPFRLGGPNFVFSKNGKKMWAATRHFFLREDNTMIDSTILAMMDEKSLTPILRLKSGLDTGYPGLLLEDNSLTVVFYAAESEEKSNIYIITLKLRH